ncbi:cyclodeaminase/cyclohydrolase family protein [Lacrimispora algidixylanolytica]|uniref:Sugar ABC transporter substrate-binding protein n=1 Tax=Lacrimispora algidixylanolytica TaxID=94868 RepID=A0A419T6R0_9FIRM|nr:cyclodeaminase/cyclohydrolase family protein [Lacrimispora algidixylanolytica]RKD33240.1 sugar ABC transporter substrate-binding protein [Lacrimispora algidixylanolytica]
MIQDFTVSSFLEELSSKKSTPGGGGAAGLAGAVGTALGEMVVNLTLGKKKYADVEEEMQSILMTLTQMREEFLRLADEDAVVFAPLAAAYSLPATTEEDKKKKEAILEDLLVSAALVPLSVMELCLKTLNLLEVLGEKGSRLAVSDVGVGVQMIRASILGAKMNVYINTKTMIQREKARELNARAQSVSEEAIRLADTIYTQVEAALKTE